MKVFKFINARSPSARATGADSRRLDAALVGRDKELTVLLACAERLRSGEGGIAGVIGEAGLGKSRLVSEAKRKLASESILWLEGRALSFSQSLSYWPFREIVRHWAGITEDDGDAASWAKLQTKVHKLFPDDVAEVLPYLATWLGVTVPDEHAARVRYLDGEAMGRQIFRTARRFFERLARERPLVLVFEDLHWTDQSSTELIEHLLPLVEMVPLLILGAGRPERDNPASRLRQAALQSYSSRYTEIRLAPLAADDTAQLVRRLLVSEAAPPSIIEVIRNKAEGNPFFVEELLRVLIDTQALVREPAGAWRLNRPIEALGIPDTLEAVIVARVDRLEEDVKQILRVASVIGRSFLYRILRALAEAERRLDRDLTELVELELIREKQRRPELEYIFKHALVQEATYGGILAECRCELHRKVAECVESLFADRLDEFAGLLAYHYARAESWDKANHFLLVAGDHAGRIAADSEALTHYRQAMAAFERASRWTGLERATLERKMGVALFRRGQHPEALEYLKRALKLLGEEIPQSKLGLAVGFLREIVKQGGRRLFGSFATKPAGDAANAFAEEHFRVLDALGWILYFIDPKYYVYLSLRLLAVGERNAHAMAVVTGSFGIGMALDLLGAFRMGEYFHRHAIAVAEASGHPLALGYANLGKAVHDEAIGRPDLALPRYQLAAKCCREAGHLRGWGLATSRIAVAYRNSGAFDMAQKYVEEMRQVSEESSDNNIQAYAGSNRAQLEWFMGLFEQAVPRIEVSLELFRAVGDYNGVTMAGGTLARLLLRLGHMDRARSVLEDTQRIIESRGLRGIFIIWPRIARTEYHLAEAEERQGAARVLALAQAKRACGKAMACARTVQTWLPAALRVQGTYLWLMRDSAGARRAWQHSLEIAAQLDALPELAFTHLEIGLRLEQPENLKKAEEILSRIGATHYLAHVRRRVPTLTSAEARA